MGFSIGLIILNRYKGRVDDIDFEDVEGILELQLLLQLLLTLELIMLELGHEVPPNALLSKPVSMVATCAPQSRKLVIDFVFQGLDLLYLLLEEDDLGLDLAGYGADALLVRWHRFVRR